MKLKYITFTLENCDQITIDGKYIGDFYVGDIKSEIKRIACNSIMKMNITKEFAIEIHKNANKEHYEHGQKDWETSVFTALTRFNDITSIEFELEEQYVEDGVMPKKEHYNYFVNWTGDSDFVNDSQKSYISKPGHLYLVIDKKSNIEDYFNSEEIDDEETMEFQFEMYDVGNEKDEDDEDVQSIDSLLCKIGKVPATENEEIISIDTFCEPAICKANVNISNTTGRKCPHCGESYYTELYSDSTAVYYPPIYKNGVNINPDRNQITTTCRCLNCGKEFTY